MQSQYRLRKRKDFAQVYRRGKSVANRQLVLIHQNGKGVRIGISVSKKLGKAHARNLIKRRLRECVRPLLLQLKPGRYIIVAREGAAGQSFAVLSASLRHLVGKGSYLREKQP